MFYVYFYMCSVCNLPVRIFISFPEMNVCLKIEGCFFETCYYGVMNQISKGQLHLKTNTFQNVPKGILLQRYSLGTDKLELEKNEFQFSDMFYPTDVNFKDSEEVEDLRKRMYMSFSIDENLPHRKAYIKENYVTISSDWDAGVLIEKNLASAISSLTLDGYEADSELSSTNYKGMI